MEIECVERGRAFRHGDLCEREDGSLGTNRHPTIRRSHFRSEKRVEEHFARPRLIGSDYIVFFFFFCLFSFLFFLSRTLLTIESYARSEPPRVSFQSHL